MMYVYSYIHIYLLMLMIIHEIDLILYFLHKLLRNDVVGEKIEVKYCEIISCWYSVGQK